MAAVAGVALVATACGGGASSASNTSIVSKTSGGSGLVSVTIAVQASISSLSINVAQEKGIFRKNGLNVTAKPVLNIAILPAAVVSGEYQFGVTVNAIFLQAAGKGLPLVASAGGDLESAKAPAVAVIVPKGSGIKGPAGLVGPRIRIGGAPPINGNTQQCLLYWMRAHGVNYKAANLVAVPWANVQAQLAAGLIQATLAVPPFSNAMIKAGDLNLGDPCFSVAPASQGSFLMSDVTWARAHSNIVKAVQTSLTEANTYIQSHPVQARQILSQTTGLSASVTRELPLPLYNGTVSVSDLRTWLHVMTVLGQSPGAMNNLAQLVFPPPAKS